MPETDIGSSIASGLTSAITDYSVDTKSTEGPADQKETSWINTKWTQYFGYYKTIPELNSTIDARATWTVGKGYEADGVTTLILDAIKGYGVDTFNTILENMVRTMWIGGDAFAEIIRNKFDIIINLKPLDPGSIKIVVDRQGLILRYEQMSKVKKPNKKFQPDEIFHLARNRVADEIHGVSVVEKLEQIILMRNEAMIDYKQIMHWFVRPRWIFHLDTDDTAKIAEFKRKMDAANAKGENMYIPKDAVVPELMAVSPNATLNPMAWIESLNDYFYEACATPKFIVGASKGFTEAAEKISLLAFGQGVKEEQLYIEEQTLSQLNLLIKLVFPVTILNELLSQASDESKDKETGLMKPSDITAGEGA